MVSYGVGSFVSFPLAPWNVSKVHPCPCAPRLPCSLLTLSSVSFSEGVCQAVPGMLSLLHGVDILPRP